MVAAAFAVALAVLVSSTAEAIEPGKSDTVEITVDPSDGSGVVRVEIDGLSTASGSFDSNDGQDIVCNDNGKCDVGEDTDNDAATENVKANGSVFLVVNIDADSADGFILLKITNVLASGGPVTTYQSINVETLPKPDTLNAKAESTTIQAKPDTTSEVDQTTITATVKSDEDEPQGMVGQTLTFITTLGNVDCDVGGNAPSQVCQIDTIADDVTTTDADEMGTATVTLFGGGREGTATVTITHATLDSATVTVTFYGDPDNLAAEADQGSVEVGGGVFVVLTVTDAAGFPVKGVEPAAPAKDAIVGPEEKSNPVKTDFDVNKLDAKGKLAVPACEAHAEITEANAQPDAVPPVLATLGSSGTNDDGECAVLVSAPADNDETATSDESATRGVNTLNFVLNKLEASVELDVAGSPATIVTDPPSGSYIDPLSDNTITITVRDDEGVLVGKTKVEIVKVEGFGLVEGIAGVGEVPDFDANSENTANGEASFNYTAPLSASTVVFRIRAGSSANPPEQVLQLHVGSEPEDVVVPPPAAPSLSSQPASTGFSLVTFSGGSIGELATAVEEACGAGGRVYATDNLGRWVSYIPAAMMGPVNAAFEQLFPDGIPANTPLLVGGCSG